MSKKVCRKCLVSKQSDLFYLERAVCKDCINHRRRGSALVKEYEKQRSRLPHRKALASSIGKKWRIENPEKLKVYNRRYANKHPERIAVYATVRNAVLCGRLIKKPCQVCGSNNRIHAHHKDYSKPLQVEWLCIMHHFMEHRQ